MVKITPDSRKLNDSCDKMRPHMPNMEEILNHLSVEITRGRTVELFISKLDLDYAYGQMKLSDDTMPTREIRIKKGKLQGLLPIKKKHFTVLPISL